MIPKMRSRILCFLSMSLAVLYCTGLISTACQPVAAVNTKNTAVYLNGEYLGLYTAIEGMDESFAYRNFGGSHGQLYKPEQYDASALLLGEKTNIVIDSGALSTDGDLLEISDLL